MLSCLVALLVAGHLVEKTETFQFPEPHNQFRETRYPWRQQQRRHRQPLVHRTKSRSAINQKILLLLNSKSEDLSHEEIARYSRHLVLNDVGMAGQRALKNSSVLVIGAGGLGSPCLLYMAAAGVGHIGIVDADIVDSSNLQRQIIHGVSTLNISKCESARRRLSDINPHVHVRTYPEEFTSRTALRILQGGFEQGRPYDVVVDGSDNFPTKYLINDACAIVNVPWVYSAILAFEGQLSVFNYNGGPDYRDLLPIPPPPGDVPSCAEGGVLGVLPGTMGCLQATETIKLLLHRQDDGICSGRVLVFDALKMKFSQVGLVRAPDREAITELIDYQGFCSGPQTTATKTTTKTTTTTTEAITAGARTMDEDNVHVVSNQQQQQNLDRSFHNIGPKQALSKLKNGWCPFVLDVRLKTEHDIVCLPFTDQVIPHRAVRHRDVPTSGDILVYCKGGVRGKKACDKLIQEGVDPNRLYNLEGGILGWQREVDPAMPRY